MEDFIEEQVWIDAQKLQQHIYTCGDSAYVFPNHKFFDKKLKVITKELIKKHINAFESKIFSNFDEKRIFWIYDHNNRTCQCKTFWQIGRCKHNLAVQIHLKQIQVKSF